MIQLINMNYKFKGDIQRNSNGILSKGNLANLTVEWYGNDDRLYKRTFYGSITNGMFSLVYGEQFNFDAFRDFIVNIKNNVPAAFDFFEINNSRECYEYDHNTKKLAVSFRIYENGMVVYFDVNDSFVKLLEDMFQKIISYHQSLMTIN